MKKADASQTLTERLIFREVVRRSCDAQLKLA